MAIYYGIGQLKHDIIDNHFCVLCNRVLHFYYDAPLIGFELKVVKEYELS